VPSCDITEPQAAAAREATSGSGSGRPGLRLGVTIVGTLRGVRAGALIDDRERIRRASIVDVDVHAQMTQFHLRAYELPIILTLREESRVTSNKHIFLSI